MTPEADAYLATAREDLRDARILATIPLNRLAARSAYFAVTHAAEAFIFERSGKVIKTHSGVQSEFSRLSMNTIGAKQSLGRILSKGYGFKDLADYGIGTDRVVSDQAAAAMIEDAARFANRVAELLASTPP